MKQWFLISRRQTTTRISKDELTDLLPDYEDKSGNRSSGEWLYIVKGRLYKNHIGFSATPGEYEVTDEQYIRWYWPALLLVSALGIIFIHSLQSGFEFSLGEMSALVFLAVLCILVLVGCYRMMMRVGPLESFWHQTESQKMRPPFQLFAVVMVLLFATVLVVFLISVFGVVALIGLVGFYWHKEEFFIERAEVEESTSMDYFGVRPVVTSYLLFIILASLPLMFFVGASLFNGFFTLLTNNGLFLITYLLTFSVIWPILVFANQKKNLKLEQYRFDREGIGNGSVFRRLLFGVAIVAVSVVFAVLSAFFSLRLGSLWSMSGAVAVTAGLFVGWPVLVVGAGLVSQFFQVVQVIGLCLRGSRRELSEEIGPDVYVVESEEPLAGAVSVGLYSFIAVSTSLVEQLGEEDLEFVLAHEEGHIVHSDALLAVLAGLVSTVILAGKNAVYALFDFEKRELRADQYALEKIGDPGQAERALDSMKELDIDATAGTVSASIPTVVSFRSDSGSEENLFSRVFEYYYGTFAVGLAHPSVEERKNRLEDD